jgi:hypothetical protein
MTTEEGSDDMRADVDDDKAAKGKGAGYKDEEDEEEDEEASCWVVSDEARSSRTGGIEGKAERFDVRFLAKSTASY